MSCHVIFLISHVLFDKNGMKGLRAMTKITGLLFVSLYTFASPTNIFKYIFIYLFIYLFIYSFTHIQHIPDKFLNITVQTATKRTDSAITRHLKDSPECRSPGIRNHFKVLKKARHQHLDILEAIFIRAKSPALCQQKEYVRNLSLV